MEEILEKVRKELKNNIDEKTQKSSQNFFKEKIKFYGVKVPVVNKISKTLFTLIKTESKSKIFDLCEKLWQSGISKNLRCLQLVLPYHKQYEPQDIHIFENGSIIT